MIIKTRVFELARGKYHNLSDLARAMGLSVSQIYRVREGKRNINQKFIIGAKKAFPAYRLDELFYLDSSQPSSDIIETNVTRRYHHITQRVTTVDF
jgi:transcriptional regulator with XRE-family HTH domain